MTINCAAYDGVICHIYTVCHLVYLTGNKSCIQPRTLSMGRPLRRNNVVV